MASNEAELRLAIDSANADGDPNATITLTNNISVVDPTALPQFTKPVTVNTGAFTLSGADAVGSGNGGSLSFLGGSLLVSGAVRGGNVVGTTSNGAGGIGLSLANGSVDNSGTVTGGAGGNNTGLNTAGGNGAVGMSLTSSTLVNRNAITGGAGGAVDVQNDTSGATIANPGDGAAGLVMSGGALDNRGTITGGAGGSILNIPPGNPDNQFGGTGGLGASLTGGTHVNSGTLQGAQGGLGRNVPGSGHGASGGGLALSGGSIVNNGVIIGANGRTGGGTDDTGGSAGGFGATLTNSTLESSGTIRGGHSGATTAGGTGIIGSNATVINSGEITAGRNQLGAGTLGNAIQFTAGTNVLELRAGSAITGNVLASGTNDTLALGGTVDSSFAVSQIGTAAQYRNFEGYQKVGTGTWTLTGTTTATTPWQLLAGTLSVSSNTNLGAAAGSLTFNGGTLRVTGTSFTSTARTINWGANGGGFDIADPANVFTVGQGLTGGGQLSKLGAGTLVLTGTNTYAGTTIEAGTLQLGNGGTTGSIVGDVFNSGTLAFNRSDTVTFGGLISGTGAVNQIGAGTTVLTANNAYTGLTTISAGTLRLGDGGTSGVVVGDILNNSVLAFNRSDTFIVPGVISGTGAVNQIGTGTTVLTGDNTYTGGTTISAGTLQLGNGGTSGSITGNVVNNSALSFNRSDAFLVPGAISGSGTVNQIGTGTTVLSEDNTYTGGTTISAGTLQLGNGGASGSITGNVLNNGTLAFNRSNTLVFGELISGSGAVNQIGTGAAVLTANNTYTGGTTISAGTLQLGNGGTSGSIAGDVFNDGTLAFDRSDDVTFGGVISGSGAVNQIGSGATVLTGNNTSTGLTTISAGTLQFGDGGTSGSIAGSILNNSVLSFNRSDAFLAPGAISGSGTVNQIGTGTTVLSGDNTYTGGTTISAGTLQLGNGGTSGSIVGDVTNNGALAFNRSDSMTFGGIISGTGNIRQIGSGLTNLTGDNSGFAGTTTVEAGTLAVNGSLCGGMNVLAGGRLQGAGTVCDTTNFAGGTIGPGNSIGTITVNGNYVGSGGLLEIETVLGGDASPTDRLVVTGDTSGSTNVRVINVGGAGAQTVEGIRIVDVGGASNGAFSLQGDFVIAGQQAVIAGAYAYTLQQNGVSTANDGDWYLRSSLVPPPPAPPGSPPPPPVPAGPLYQPGVPIYESYGQVLLSLNELSTLQQRVGNRHLGGSDAMAQMGAVKAVASGPAAVDPVWGRFEGWHLNLNPSTTARSTFDADYWKFEGGIDALTLDKGIGKLVFGITGHYNEADADVSSFFGNGTIRTRGGGFGGTATWYGYDGFYVDSQARASWYSSNLNSAVVGTEVSNNGGFGYALGVESGKRFASSNGWSLTPQAQLTYGAVDFDTFRDRFGAIVSLGRAESLLGRVGISLDHQRSWRDASGQLMRSDVYGIANLHYEFLDGTTVDVSGTRFASSADRLWGGIGAGGTFSWANDRYAVYGELSYKSSLDEPGDNYSYKGTAGFRVRW